MGSTEKKMPTVLETSRKSSSDSAASLKSPRTPRFAEATSVDSPIEPSAQARMFAARPDTRFLAPQAQPADIGFGYIGDRSSHHSAQIGQAVEVPLTPRSPLKSALKSPGAPSRNIPNQNPLSPTWKEEEVLDKQEEHTEKEQQKDLKVKLRVRIAKMALRFTNFSCSLIVLAMLSSTFSIFNATKSLPSRNSLPPWAAGTVKWPAILLLCISCVSLFMSIVVIWGYFRGGHRRAQKVQVYYTTFAVGFFVFSIVMWGIGAGVLQSTKNNANGNDIWGWSCKNNPRKTIFQNEVDYNLVCRMQNWSLVCALIEIIVEVITITIYGIVFYRFYSKRRLAKSMYKRDTARSDLYLAQLRSQSAPNTPGPMSARFGPNGAGVPLSPREGGYNPMFSPRYANSAEKDGPSASVNEISAAEEGVRYIDAPAQPPAPKPFTLQSPPPKKATPKMHQGGFDGSSSSQPASPSAVGQAISTPSATAPPVSPRFAEAAPVHTPAAPGEQQYAAVPIPGAYSSPIHSPTHPPNTATGEYFQALR